MGLLVPKARTKNINIKEINIKQQNLITKVAAGNMRDI